MISVFVKMFCSLWSGGEVLTALIGFVVSSDNFFTQEGRVASEACSHLECSIRSSMIFTDTTEKQSF